MNLIKTIALGLSFVSVGAIAATTTATTPTAKTYNSIYDIPVKTLIGEETTLAGYKGKTMLIVNTASHCGYTPQYQGLQELFTAHKNDGVVVLGFPSNDFGKQEPGTAKEIKDFCDTKYHVTFPLYEKNPVSDKTKQPLYQWLVSHDPSFPNSEVKWNFEKFVVSKNGTVVARLRSGSKPDSTEMKDALAKAMK